MKKNEVIKDFVNRTLIEKVGTTRTATKILEVMSEKYDRNMGEKTSEMMRKISGEGYKSDESVDKIIVSSLYERVCLDPIKYVRFKTGNASHVH